MEEIKQEGNVTETSAVEEPVTPVAAEEGNNAPDTSAGEGEDIATLKAQLAKEKEEKEIYKGGLHALKDKIKEQKAPKVESKEETVPKTPEETSEAKRLVEELQRTVESNAAANDGAGTGVTSNVNNPKPRGALSEAQENEAKEKFRQMGFNDDEIASMVKRYERNVIGGSQQVNQSHIKKRLH